MTRVCELAGTRVLSGNNVSHSHRKTRRKFLPNLQSTHLFSESLGLSIPFRVTPRTLRSVDKNGGLDRFLLATSAKNLSPKAKLLRAKLQKSSQLAPIQAKTKRAPETSKRSTKKRATK